MMIAMMIMLLCVKVSLLMTSNASFLHRHHQMQVSHELGFDQHVLSHGLSRKLMLKEMVEGYGDQDLGFYNDQKEALSGETRKRGEEMMVNDVKGSDPTYFSSMDYSHVRSRRSIHNKSYSKTTNSP